MYRWNVRRRIRADKRDMTELRFNPNGAFNRARVDWIEANVVTEAAIDAAIKPRGKHHGWGSNRERTGRNIALGLNCGSYPWPGLY